MKEICLKKLNNGYSIPLIFIKIPVSFTTFAQVSTQLRNGMLLQGWQRHHSEVLQS